MNELNVSPARLGALDCTVVDALPDGAAPRLGVVLCHGFGAPGTDLAPLSAELLRLAPSLAEHTRFVFPQAPLSLDAEGMYGGRAWWMLDIAKLNAAIANCEMRDQRHVVPEGMAQASGALAELVEQFQQDSGLSSDRIVLGGFSQGSMVSTDVALRMNQPPAALVVLSGTLLCEQQWRELANRRGPLPVLQSHGASDRILPYAGAVWLRDMFEECGQQVDFVEFAGEHSIPPQAMEKLAQLLVGAADQAD